MIHSDFVLPGQPKSAVDQAERTVSVPLELTTWLTLAYASYVWGVPVNAWR